MTRIEHTIVIDARIEKVFNYASDHRKWDEWFEGVSAFNPTTAITRGNGARYAYKARLMGVSASVETEVHGFIENRGWTGVATKGMPHRTYWTFTPTSAGTRFTYALEYQLPIPLLGPLLDSLFMRAQWDKIIVTSLENLRKRFAEGKAG